MGNLTLFAQGGSVQYDVHTWSPDGRWLASEGTGPADLTLFSANGRLVNELHLGCNIGGINEDFSWLPDGRLSCFISNEPPILILAKLDAKGQVVAKTTASAPLTPGTTTFTLQWNPHHDWLATIAESMPGAVTYNLYISDLQGHELIAPTRVNAQVLAWSPDGTRLALVQLNGDITLLQVQQTPSGQLSVTTLRQLAAGTTPDDSITWSPSGKWLVCRHRSYQSEDYLFLLAADGSGKTVKITSSTTDGQLYDPAWSPDGKQLIVGKVPDGSLMSLDMRAVLKEKGVKP
jgi:Tol biopolymer transport system component